MASSKILESKRAIVSEIEDSNLIKRAGNVEVIDWSHKQAQKYLVLGGYGTQAGKQFMLELNRSFKEKNYSLGGSADLLIITIFMGLQRGMI